jgi:release factor glutamine methyltransferase
MMIDIAGYHQQWVERCHQERAYHEIFWILQDVLSISWASLHTSLQIEPAVFEQLEAKLARYKKGEPLAYILGHIDFMQQRFEVQPGVLIPREDTAILVQAVLPYLKRGQRVLELGTGSGIISLTLAKQFKELEIMAIDHNPLAVTLAKKNMQHLGLQIEILQQSWFDPLPTGFDVIISNPPYIDEHDPHLDESVKAYEPSSAWCSADDGYADLFAIIEISRSLLLPGGLLALEHGFLQQERLCECALQKGYRVQDRFSDDADHERALILQRSG